MTRCPRKAGAREQREGAWVGHAPAGMGRSLCRRSWCLSSVCVCLHVTCVLYILKTKKHTQNAVQESKCLMSQHVLNASSHSNTTHHQRAQQRARSGSRLRYPSGAEAGERTKTCRCSRPRRAGVGLCTDMCVLLTAELFRPLGKD